MNPRTLLVHYENPEPRHIRQAIGALENGEIVLVPTETGYCFVGDPHSSQTQQAFLTLREEHPKKKPFSIVCKDITQASGISIINTSIFRIASRILPGPYTLILDSSRSTPKHAGAKRKTVGIRISSHPILQHLLLAYNQPLLITSVTDAEELMVQGYFDKQLEEDAWWTLCESIVKKFNHIDIPWSIALEDSEPVPMAVSTVIDFTTTPPTLVRDGGWDQEALGLIS